MVNGEKCKNFVYIKNEERMEFEQESDFIAMCNFSVKGEYQKGYRKEKMIQSNRELNIPDINECNLTLIGIFLHFVCIPLPSFLSFF